MIVLLLYWSFRSPCARPSRVNGVAKTNLNNICYREEEHDAWWCTSTLISSPSLSDRTCWLHATSRNVSVFVSSPICRGTVPHRWSAGTPCACCVRSASPAQNTHIHHSPSPIHLPPALPSTALPSSGNRLKTSFCSTLNRQWHPCEDK